MHLAYNCLLKNLLITFSFLLSANSFAETITFGNSAATKAQLSGNFIQGGFIKGKTQPNNIVSLNNKSIRVTPQGDFAFGFGRDAKPTSVLIVTSNLQNQPPETISQTLTIKQRKYKLQRVDGVPQKTVTPPASVLARIKKETQQVKSARKTNSDHTAFLETFQWPLMGPITGVYGSQRIYNGTPKRPHYGLDIAAPVGTMVKAPVDGIVTLAHQNMYYSGGTLIMDHGYGISSTFIHLDEVLVKVGDPIKQGDVVAKVGSKGRSTGPHLDWRMNWYNTRLDPALIMPTMPKH